MRKWLLNFIEVTIFVIISLACLIVLLQSTVFNNKSILGYRSYVIASNSMYPVFEYGDVILVKDIAFQDIEVNDIITYQGVSGELKDKVITHEVIEIFYENDVKVLKTKGRANTGVDPNVYEEQIYGKFAYKFIVVSFISKIVRDEIGFVFFVFIPFGILFILEFINMVKETKRRELEKIVKTQLEELKKLENKSKKAIEIEQTMCVQLDEIVAAKRDFKKMNELEYTVRIPLEELIASLEKLKEIDVKDTKQKEVLLEETKVLFSSDDIRKEISKELKLREKKISKNELKNEYELDDVKKKKRRRRRSK